MLEKFGIDGIYIDDTTLDRYALRRARKLIDFYRPDGRIDMHYGHYGNQWFGHATAPNLYMELFPYLDTLWVGEGYYYDFPPDRWLIEISGIPFGVPCQLMRERRSVWRGMVYGQASRAGWGNADLIPLWRFFDEYRMAERTMIGFWDESCPVSCDHPSIKASVFQGKDDLVLAVANWSETAETTTIDIDAKALGGNPEDFIAFQPEIEKFQEQRDSVSLKNLLIPPGKGFILVLTKKQRVK